MMGKMKQKGGKKRPIIPQEDWLYAGMVCCSVFLSSILSHMPFSLFSSEGSSSC